MGILEPDPKVAKPCPLEAIDLIVTPGVAFSKTGKRLGYGGGYYDRFFAKIAGLQNPAPKVALIPESQIFDDIPTDEHDLPVDFLISERGIIDCRKAKQ